MTIDDLTVDLARCNPATLLDDWAWLLPDDAKPVLVTLWGDVFLCDAEGRIRYLDTCEATITEIADDAELFRAMLDSPPFVEQWFHPEEVELLRTDGLELGLGECFSYKHPPVLGGADDPDNIEVCDVAVHLSLSGQIHQQVKDLPDGTAIDEVKIVAPPARKPWWRFW